MDKIMGKASEAIQGKSSSSSGAAPQSSGQEDYSDKGLDAAEKKFGYQGNRETNEKVTDGARDFIEKKSGKKIPEKFSN